MLGVLKKRKKEEAIAMFANRRRVPVEKAESKVNAELSDDAASLRTARFSGAAKVALQLVLAAGATAFVVLGGIAAYRHATTSDYFKFATVEISGNSRLKNDEVLSAAGLNLGTNIFSTDVVRAEAGLLQNPWIETAEVIRHLPGTIVIRVTERKARALVNLDVLYLVDDMGRVFKRWVRGDPVPSPIITGISREEYIQSPSSIEAVLCDALDLADRYTSVGLERTMPLQEIFREPDLGFSLTVGEDPVYVKFGKGPYKKKLARLAQLLRRLAGDNKRPGQIFFDNAIRPDRITVKLKREETGDAVNNSEIQSNETKKIVSKI